MGYYLNYALAGTQVTQPPNPNYPPNPMHPGTVRGGLFRFGSLASEYLVVGPTDGSQPFELGDVESFSATVTVVPEPGSLVVSLTLGVCVLVARRWRQKSPARNTT